MSKSIDQLAHEAAEKIIEDYNGLHISGSGFARWTEQLLTRIKRAIVSAAKMSELKMLEDGIQSFHRYCEMSCEARDCIAYTDCGLRCPECPKEYSEELKACIKQSKKGGAR